MDEMKTNQHDSKVASVMSLKDDAKSRSEISQSGSRLIWQQILEEAEDGRRTYDQLKNSKAHPDPAPFDTESAMLYLDRQIMPLLLPAVENTLQQAIKWECLQLQKCRFNGIDNIVEILWNKNPIYPQRAENWTTLYEIPMVKTSLALNPRPIFPKSWIWTRDEAASVIQAAVRSFLLRCQPEVQEMRQFWKAMRQIAAEERRQKKEEEERLAEKERKIQEMKDKELQEVTSYITDILLANAMTIVEANTAREAINTEYFEPYLSDMLPSDYDSGSHYKEQTIQTTDLDQDENENEDKDKE